MTANDLAAPATLADLLAPISIATLIDHIESRRTLYMPVPRPDRFDGLFSWSRLGEILARGTVEADRFFLFAGGRQLDPRTLGALDNAGRIDPSLVRALFQQGATFTLPNIQAHFAETERLVSDVEWRLGERVELRAIAASSSGTCIPLHFDTPDLLVLQIEGEKEWTLFGDPVPGSCRYRTLEERPNDISERFLLRRGDVLFLPSGLHHQCQPEGDSLHLAISIYRRTGMDFVDHLRTLAAEDLSFFDGLPNLASENALAEHEARLKQRLMRLIETADLRGFLRDDDRRRARPRHVSLMDASRGEQTSETLLMPSWSRRLAFPDKGPVRVGGRSYDPDPAARAALERLEAAGRLSARQLIGDMDLQFGAGAGEKAIAALIDDGLIQAVNPQEPR